MTSFLDRAAALSAVRCPERHAAQSFCIEAAKDCIAPWRAHAHTPPAHLELVSQGPSMPVRDKLAINHGNACLETLKLQSIHWIWDGFVAEGAVTLLSAPEKTGKTTFL